MGDLREKVARAICCPEGCWFRDGDAYCFKGNHNDGGAMNCLEQADAAIAEVLESLRAPTEAMLGAAYALNTYREHMATPVETAEPEQYWQAMLAAWEKDGA